MKKIILIIQIFVCTYSYGEGVGLVCVDKNNGYTMSVVFDEKNQTVNVSNRTLKASITENEIFYQEKGGDNRIYFSKLNRSTGVLQVYEKSYPSSNSIIDSTFQCSIGSKKF
ncbi:hypothetical protein DPM18_08135 [Polynucleobacter paneuropaeus]|jgi:hypothetical protein|uniref:hypothetical protein n=1 Tax=Polynucleobacter paneuropaeus TaxID=2527775 RepID=UPI000DBEF78E|nr:hypothetical protein [Polynucleobacter paneuropaeus]AWW46780.1 hypothetical protein DPM18_08135 [Polynucleobacter paneuropaeus]